MPYVHIPFASWAFYWCVHSFCMQLVILCLVKSTGCRSVNLVVRWTSFFMSDMNFRVSALRGVPESMDT